MVLHEVTPRLRGDCCQARPTLYWLECSDLQMPVDYTHLLAAPTVNVV